jgi:asparagine synthase (glutamine-hydrolysing)
MCGFVGVFGNIRSFDIANSLQKLKHRGPNSSGIRNGPDWLVGFSRLSILDLSEKGMQPFENERCIVYLNGEIYNFIELTQEFAADFKPQTGSDVEIVPYLYKRFGIEFLHKLNGMFSMILIDKKENSKYLIKDRFGEKPLYYSANGNSIFFASEIKALKNLTGLSPDPAQVLINLACYGVPPPCTLYKEAIAIAPGALLKIQKNLECIEVKWYRPKLNQDRNHFDPTTFEMILRDSIAIRTRADVPISVFLSGGIDSMIIAGILKQNRSGFAALTANIPGKETRDVDTDVVNPSRFCSEESIRQISETIDYNYWNKNILRIVANYEEVFVDSGNLVFYALGELAQKHGFKVALTGVGGDELFGGYPWQERLVIMGRLGSHFGHFGAGLEEMLESLCRGIPRSRFREILIRVIQHIFFPSLSQLTSLGGGLVEDILSSKTNAGVLLRALAKDKFNYKSLPKWMDWENKVNLLNFNNIVPFQNYKCDMGTMSASVENRNPFLDHRVVEIMINVAHKEKIEYGKKGLLRKIASGILPSYILEAPKSGPTMPVHLWFQGSRLKNAVKFIQSSRNLLGDLFGATFADYWCGKIPQWEKPAMALRLFLFIHLILWIKMNFTKELPETDISFETMLEG